MSNLPWPPSMQPAVMMEIWPISSSVHWIHCYRGPSISMSQTYIRCIPLQSQILAHRSPHKTPLADQWEVDKQVELFLSLGLLRSWVRSRSCPDHLCPQSYWQKGKTNAGHWCAMTTGTYTSLRYLDIMPGYWCMSMKLEDTHKAVLITPTGCYKWFVMPYKTHKPPHNELLRTSLPNIHSKTVTAPTFEEHFKPVDVLLWALQVENVKPKKCQSERFTIHNFVEVMWNFPCPAGTLIIYEWHVNSLSGICLPLTDLLDGPELVKWDS